VLSWNNLERLIPCNPLPVCSPVTKLRTHYLALRPQPIKANNNDNHHFKSSRRFRTPRCMAAGSTEFCKVAWLSGSGLGFPVLMCQLAYETGEGRWRDATATPNWSLMEFLVLRSSSRAYSRRPRRRPRLSISGYANKASGPRAAGLLHCLVTHTHLSSSSRRASRSFTHLAV